MRDSQTSSTYRRGQYGRRSLVFLYVFVVSFTLYTLIELGGQFSEILQWTRYLVYFPLMLVGLALSKICPTSDWVRELYVDFSGTWGLHLVIRAVTYASMIVIALWPFAKYRETGAKRYYILSLLIGGVVLIGGSIVTISAVIMLLWADR